MILPSQPHSRISLRRIKWGYNKTVEVGLPTPRRFDRHDLKEESINEQKSHLFLILRRFYSRVLECKRGNLQLLEKPSGYEKNRWE